MTETASPQSEPASSTAAVDRRAWVRYGTDGEVLCRATGPLKDVGWMGKVRDLSLGGVGLFLRHRFRPGTPLLVELKSRAGGEIRLVPARVVHATAIRAEDGAWWLVGCAFVSPLREDELKALL
jgi:hypothetical protein